ncbi:MAG: hypothetical protein QG659_327 [Patescibacteria group bacterium]|nr:hypothetical protein [Patescibacteria group bacterium]
MLFATAAAHTVALVAVVVASLIPNINNRAYAAGAYTGSHGSNVFVMLVKTDNAGASSSTQFTIPTTGAGYNYSVDCDDNGLFDATGQTGNYTCNYGSAGTYSVVISGTFPSIYFNNTGDRLKLLEIQQWGNNAWSSMYRAFYGAANMQLTAVDTPNLSNVTNMSSMFNGATSFNQNINNWDVSHVTDFLYAFQGASSFNQDLNSWNTSSAINMGGMFLLASSFNGDISSWDTSQVTSMNSMFNTSAFNQDISAWNVSNVTGMQNMLRSTPFNYNIGGWNVSGVTNMYRMFAQSSFNQDISGWDVSSVTTMKDMFSGATAFNQNISAWNVSNVTDMSGMFYLASSFNQSLGLWGVGSVTTANGMFSYSGISTATYDIILSGWDGQTLQNNVPLGAVGKTYCTAATDRQNIITNYNWIITDAGQGCQPQITTGGATVISTDSATVELNLVDDGGGTVSALAIQYGLDTNYGSTAYSSDGFGEGLHSITINSLTCETMYHYRAYVTTNAGTVYGNDATFTTSACPAPPILPDLKLDIALSEPGLIQGQQANYTFTVANVTGGVFADGSTNLYIVAPDGFELPNPIYNEDEGVNVYTDETTYWCIDYTTAAVDIPAFAYHLGTFYLCTFVTETLSPGQSQDITLTFNVSAPVDEQTAMRGVIVSGDTNAEQIGEAFNGTDDIYTLSINNVAVYTGTQPGSTSDQGGAGANQAILAGATAGGVLGETGENIILLISSAVAGILGGGFYLKRKYF